MLFNDSLKGTAAAIAAADVHGIIHLVQLKIMLEGRIQVRFDWQPEGDATEYIRMMAPDGGKRGGIELHLPGVHCDVGGSYVEGRAEKVNRIEASFDYHELKKLRLELISEGWFKPEELNIFGSIYDNDDTLITDKNYRMVFGKMVLNASRKSLSNQYSYIPLHLMVEFCKMKGVFSNDDYIKVSFSFKENWIKNNIAFLQEIEARLKIYAFNGGPRFVMQSPEIFIESTVKDNDDATAAQLLEQRQKEGQRKLDDVAAQQNKQLIFLRNHYLHWNSAYGNDDLTDIITQPYHPNKEHDVRKRKIR